MRSQASSPVERYADYKTHCLHEIGWANAGVTTPIPLWVRNTGRPVDVPWFMWELSNRVPCSCPVRRIPRQDPLHTTGFSCLRLRQWPVTYLITLSDWIMSCQPGRHAVVTVCEPDWKHKWAAYKSFDETSSFNNLQLLFLRNRSLQILQRYVMCPPRGIREISMGFSP